MMKFVYIALIPILAVLIAIYTAMLLSYHPFIIDKNATRLTDSLIKNSPALDIQELAAYKDTIQHSMPSDIWGSNLFDPNRGGMTSASGSDGLKNVELVGIFNDGNVKGAVIIMKTGDSGTAGRSSSAYGGYGTPSQADHYSATQKQQVHVPPKAVFKIGDRLSNGLILESIGKDFVMLHGGKESVKLQMTFSDDNSLKRIAEASRIGVKPPVTIISGTQGAASHGGQSGTGSPLTVTPGGSSSSNAQSQGIFQGYGH